MAAWSGHLEMVKWLLNEGKEAGEKGVRRRKGGAEARKALDQRIEVKEKRDARKRSTREEKREAEAEAAEKRRGKEKRTGKRSMIREEAFAKRSRREEKSLKLSKNRKSVLILEPSKFFPLPSSSC